MGDLVQDFELDFLVDVLFLRWTDAREIGEDDIPDGSCQFVYEFFLMNKVLEIHPAGSPSPSKNIFRLIYLNRR